MSLMMNHQAKKWQPTKVGCHRMGYQSSLDDFHPVALSRPLRDQMLCQADYHPLGCFYLLETFFVTVQFLHPQ
jgi:hypothetical protein